MRSVYSSLFFLRWQKIPNIFPLVVSITADKFDASCVLQTLIFDTVHKTGCCLHQISDVDVSNEKKISLNHWKRSNIIPAVSSEMDQLNVTRYKIHLNFNITKSVFSCSVVGY